MYLRAGMDVAMGKQVFVKSGQQLVEVRGRISLSLTITWQLFVTVFLQFAKRSLLYEHGKNVEESITHNNVHRNILRVKTRNLIWQR